MGDTQNHLKIPLTIYPSRMFNGLILHGDTLIPTVVPLVIQSVTPIATNPPEKLVKFGIGCPFEWVKLKIDSVDRGAFTYKFTIIEGDSVIMARFASIKYDIKIVASADGGSGSTYHCETSFTPKLGCLLTDKDTQSDKAYQSLIVKSIEAFLYANLDVFPDGV